MGLTRQQTTMIAVLLAGAFLVVLNQTLLTPALPTIMSHFECECYNGSMVDERIRFS